MNNAIVSLCEPLCWDLNLFHIAEMGHSLVPFLSLGWLATLTIALWFIQSLRSYLRLRQFPGPPVAAWSKLWMMRSTLHGRMHLDVAEACKQYGTSIFPKRLIILTD